MPQRRHAGPRRHRRLVIAAATVAALIAVVAVLALAGAHGRRYYADARGHLLGAGPALGAYPYARQQNPKAVDRWGFAERQCTSYVAWYLNSHGVPFARETRGPTGTGRFGDATTWAAAARRAGFDVSRRPRVGAVAEWSAGESSLPGAPSGASALSGLVAGCHGHVAVVVRVYRDSSVDVAEYNGNTRQFAWRHDRAPRYLYLGLAGPAAPPTSRPSTALQPPTCNVR